MDTSLFICTFHLVNSKVTKIHTIPTVTSIIRTPHNADTKDCPFDVRIKEVRLYLVTFNVCTNLIKADKYKYSCLEIQTGSASILPSKADGWRWDYGLKVTGSCCKDLFL